jgi:hypothetical protein
VPIALGPSPDDGFRWAVDFDEAERRGLALRLPVGDLQRIDRLLVVGLIESRPPAELAKALADWIDKQRTTHGLALVPQGTPTRNTAGAPAGRERRPATHDAAFRVERGDPLCKAGDGGDGDALAHALGVDAARLAHVAGADGRDQRRSRAMLTALWPVTWGYFLQHMMHPVFEEDDVAWARAHALDNLRASGPLPAVRVGEHVYGVLPVLDPGANLESPIDTRDPRAVAALRFLARARRVWEKALERNHDFDRVPQLRPDGADPERALLAILRQSASSLRYAVAPVHGAEAMEIISQLLGPLFALVTGWQDLRGSNSDALLAQFGLNLSKRPVLAFATSEPSDDVQIPLVAAAPSDDPPAPDQPNFLRWLRTAPHADLRDAKFDGDKSALLFWLLRHSVLLAYASAANDVVRKSVIGIILWVEAQVFGIGDQTPKTPWALLDTFLLEKQKSAGAFLDAFMAGHDPASSQGSFATALAPFAEVRDALALLETLPTAAIDRLAAETLDLSSHRLDAWITSFATRRLAELRAATPTGARVGAYSWIEGLERAPQKPVASPPPGEDPGLFDAPGSDGYLLAPSLRHAATAAVLRSGQLAHDAALAAESSMGFDLAPARVRVARRILEGLRAGQPLGALLGYRFERSLHEASLDAYVAPLRAIAPLVANKRPETAAAGPVEMLAASDVVDGVTLHRLHRDKRLTFGAGGLPAEGTPDHARLSAALDALDDAYAAVSDILIAESVHQLVGGDHARSHAALDAIAAGEGVPAEIDVLETPRTGVACVHRVGVVLAASSPAPGWPTNDRQVRAVAEPRLDAWAGRWLGDPRHVRFSAQPIDADGAAVGNPVALSFDALGLSALDVLAIAGDDAEAEIDDRLRELVLSGAGAPKGAVSVAIGPPAAAPAGSVPLPAFLACTRLLRALAWSARPLNARDLRPHGATGGSGVDDPAAAEIEKRASTLTSKLDALGKALVASDDAALDAALQLARGFGIASRSGGDRRARAAAALAAVADRQQKIAAVRAAPAGADERVSRAAEILRAALGADIPVVPPFRLDNAAEVKSALAASPAATDADPFPVVTWMQRAARARAGVDRLRRAALGCETLGAGWLLDPRVCQVPSTAGAPWIGASIPASGLPANATAAVLVGGAALDPASACAGLAIDEWVEVVPNDTETAAVAFHYDEPTNRPPHAILLAVAPFSPDATARSWTYQKVARVVDEARRLAKIRAVDQTALFGFAEGITSNLNQYLPAVYLATNPEGDTISTSADNLVNPTR